MRRLSRGRSGTSSDLSADEVNPSFSTNQHLLSPQGSRIGGWVKSLASRSKSRSRSRLSTQPDDTPPPPYTSSSQSLNAPASDQHQTSEKQSQDNLIRKEDSSTPDKLPIQGVQSRTGTGNKHNPSQGQAVSGDNQSAESSSDEDEFIFLERYDVVFVVDDSRSMNNVDIPGAQSRWFETLHVLNQVVEICIAKDTDGPDLFFLNRKNCGESIKGNVFKGGKAEEASASTCYRHIKDFTHAQQIFEAVKLGNYTPLGSRLEHILPRLLQAERQQQTKAIEHYCHYRW